MRDSGRLAQDTLQQSIESSVGITTASCTICSQEGCRYSSDQGAQGTQGPQGLPYAPIGYQGLSCSGSGLGLGLHPTRQCLSMPVPRGRAACG